MSDFILGPNQTKWIEALESGKYQQGRTVLHKDTGAMCCLGVAANIFAEENNVTPEQIKSGRHAGCYKYKDATTVAPEYVINALSLRDGIGGAEHHESLISLNDGDGYNFANIAGVLRKNAEFYFKESS